jgi:hypothetical protein
MLGSTKLRHRILGAGAATLALGAGALVVHPSLAQAAIASGTALRDVIAGADNDNAGNTFIQPAGVAAKQHMDSTDVLLGGANSDLLIGNLGGDTVAGEGGDDILVGGPERGQAPNGDVLLGGTGHDINIWAPGDGSDAFVGGSGHDTMVFAPFQTNADGSLLLTKAAGRQVPRVDIGGKPQFSCEIVRVPADKKLGARFLVRFFAGGNLAVTVRQTDVEQLLCPSPLAGHAQVADLTDHEPTLVDVPVYNIHGTLGTIVAVP